MAALRKRVWQLSGIAAFRVSKSKMWSSFERALVHPSPVSGTRHYVKSNEKHFVTRLEGEKGFSKQAKTEMMRECNRSKFKSEVHNSQDHRGELRNVTEDVDNEFIKLARSTAKKITYDLTISAIAIGILIWINALTLVLEK